MLHISAQKKEKNISFLC